MLFLRKIGLVLMCMGMVVEIFSQNVSDLPANSFPFNFTGQTVMAFDNRYEGVKGTYLFFETFSPGSIELKGGKYENVLINYDAYHDHVLAKSEKVEGWVQLRKDMIGGFTLKNETGEEFHFEKKKLKGSIVFMLRIVRDSISWYCKVSKTIKKADVGGAYNIAENRFDQFVTVNSYYVDKGDNQLMPVQNNKKGVLKVFPEYEKQLTEYLRHSKVDFDDYDQIRALSGYINSLER